MNTGQDNAQRKLHNRIFSEDFKRQKVKELDDKTISICQLVTLYSISRTTVYKWLAKYSVHYPTFPTELFKVLIISSL